MDIKTAAAYIRVSTEDQTEYSPDAQLRELREYAAAHGMLLDDRFIYADEGISGRKADRRPAFMEMIRTAKLKEHPFDVVLVHKFDRFARSREDSVVYKAMLKRCGVDVVSIKEPIADGSYGGVMEAIYESFAEAYSINLGQEVKKGMTEKALRGEIQTAPPYGYMLSTVVAADPIVAADPVVAADPSGHTPSPVVAADPQRTSYASHMRQNPPSVRTFVPHPEEAPYVQELYRRFAAGEGLFPLAKWLNACGQHTHRGTPFENRTVEYILRNPIYVGKVRWNPKRRSRRDYDDPDIIIAQGSHEPLVSQALFDAVQTRIAEIKALHRYHGRPSFDRKHWLAGIVRCADCGATLIWAKPHYFKCNNYVRGRCHSSQHVKADLLAAAVLERLRIDAALSAPPEVRVIRLEDDADRQLRLLRQQLDQTERKQQRLLDAYLSGADIPIPRYNELTAAFRAEADALRAQIATLTAGRAQPDTRSLLRSAISDTLAILESDADTPTKYEAASRLIEHCTFDRAQSLLTITYRLTI